MFWSVRTQEKDALIINLAGRQRMLTQKMTWLALTQLDNPELSASIELFDQTLQALRFGGTTTDSAGNPVHLPPPPDPALHAQLDDVSQTWDHFRHHLQPPDMAALPREAPLILDQLDAVVSAFENRAEAKQNRLQWIQMTFLIAAMLLLAWDFITTRRRIVSPLTELGRAARVAPRLDVRQCAYDYAPGEGRRYYAQLQGYQKMPDDELLSIENISLTISVDDLVSRPGMRVNCEHCGEEVINEREVIQDGRILCQTCAGYAYYKTLGNIPLLAVDSLPREVSR